MAARWFWIKGEGKGDRTLAEQLRGLEPALAAVRGRRVLDIGCAEGLIAMHCARAGAADVTGIEIVAAHVEIARRLAASDPALTACRFWADSIEDHAAREMGNGGRARYDWVLALGVLHKLIRPAAVVDYLAAVGDRLVIRYAAATPGYIQDGRSEYRRFDVRGCLAAHGFGREQTLEGPRGEAVDYFRR